MTVCYALSRGRFVDSVQLLASAARLLLSTMSSVGRLGLRQNPARLLLRQSQIRRSVSAFLIQQRSASVNARSEILQHTDGHPHSTSTPPSLVGNPYKDGPSAIDKAVHLFFFTEILRGTYFFKPLETSDFSYLNAFLS